MQFLYSAWMSLGLPTRIRIASEFGIKKFGPTHVRDNVVESDGYLIKDVEEALSLENLQKHFNTTETDLNILWSWLMHGKPEITSPTTSSAPAVELKNVTGTKPRGRQKTK